MDRELSFLCHLTGEILNDPVWGADGHPYERRALANFLSNKPTSDTDNTDLHTLLSSKPINDAPQLKVVIQKLLFLVDKSFSEELAEGVVDDMNKQLHRSHFTTDACVRVKNDIVNNMEQMRRERDGLLKGASLKTAREKIEEEERLLLERESSLRKKRELLQKRYEKISIHDEKLNEYEKRVWSVVNEKSRMNVEEDNEYQSLKRQVQCVYQRLERLKKTNISNEAFHIWHDGPFGIINGFRLGRLSNNANVQVEWAEVNAAWGQAALLLATIAGKLGFTFSHYRVIPMGSYSKIAKVGQERFSTTYDLSTNGRMGFFSGSTFNSAMESFLVCLSELCNDATKYDRSLMMPYEMNPERGELIHNGVSVSIKLSGSTEEKWTMACKCMLTNLKWLLSWSTKTWRMRR
jgi:beclin